MASKVKERPALSPDETEMANRVLDYLVGRADKNWQRRVNQLFGETGEVDLINGNVGVAMARLDVENAIGAVEIGTGKLKEQMGIDNGELFQKGISALKAENRLVQAGRGRGRLLIVIGDKPVGEPARVVRARAPRTPAKRQTSPNTIVNEIDKILAGPLSEVAPALERLKNKAQQMTWQ